MRKFWEPVRNFVTTSFIAVLVVLGILLVVALLSCRAGAAPRPPAALLPRPALCAVRPCVVTAAVIGDVEEGHGPYLAGVLAAAAAAKADAVVLGIVSRGGDYDTAAALYKAVAASPVPVYCYVQDVAASAAFWLLQACTERVAAADATLVMHQAVVVVPAAASLNRTELARLLGQLDAADAVMAAGCAPRLGLAPAAWAAKLAQGDWVMDGLEALAAHAIDAVAAPGGPEAYRDGVRRRLAAAKR